MLIFHSFFSATTFKPLPLSNHCHFQTTATRPTAYLERKDNEKKAYLAKMQPIWDAEAAEKKAIAEKSNYRPFKKVQVPVKVLSTNRYALSPSPFKQNKMRSSRSKVSCSPRPPLPPLSLAIKLYNFSDYVIYV